MNDFDPKYLAYIKSSEWKNRCDGYFARFGRFCKACGTTKGPLQVHHMSYDRLGREPWADLVSLCNKCHRDVHLLHRKTGRRISLREATQLYIRDRRKMSKRHKTDRKK